MSCDSLVLSHHYLHNILCGRTLHFRRFPRNVRSTLDTQAVLSAIFDSAASRVIDVLYGGTAFCVFNVSDFLLDRVSNDTSILGIDWNGQGHLI